MKAWYVTLPGCEDEYCDIVFAETRGKARVKGMGALGLDRWDFTNLRVRREPSFDGDPRTLTPLEYVEAGFWFDCYGRGCWLRVCEIGEGEGYADERGNVYCPECWKKREEEKVG